MVRMKRRKFVENVTKAGIAGSMLPLTGKAFYINKSTGLNDQIHVGLIGCRGMGWANTNSLLKMKDVVLAGICDVDRNQIDRRLQDHKKLRANAPKIHSDYRQLLADPEIDAVVIGTPDHWHCKMMVDAVNAGKDVYVEKPVANSIQECYIMAKAAEKTGKVVQTGQWQRSGGHYQKAYEMVQSGILGDIRLVKVWAYQGWMKPVPVLPDTDAPEGVDYDFWLGMAPKRKFNPNRFHFNYRWFWDYSGGLMTDWGVHQLDFALYAMQAKTPKSVVSSGGKIAYKNDAAETPDTLQAIYEFQDFNMLWEHAVGIDYGPYQRREGIAFIGNNATLVVNREGYEVLIEREGLGYSKWGKHKIDPIEAYTGAQESTYQDNHTRNFIDAVKQKNPEILNTPISSGSLAAINAQMGNISYRTKEKVFWDDTEQKFTDNHLANKLAKALYHNGWKLPVV